MRDVTFDIARVADPGFFAENRLPAHSDHRWFRTRAEAASGVSGFEQSLNGVWKLHWAPNPAGVLPGFERPDLDRSAWDDIPVPGHPQLHGHGRPQYVNVQYPWDGHEAVGPGQVPTRHNPVATYATTFTLDRPLDDGERVAVCFHGAESAVAVWLNGAYVGYGADSFTPSELDLTPALRDGENVLVAQVIQWTAGSWIEDQDMFRFSGIFRDVVLYRRPRVHVEDLRVTCEVAENLASARVTVRTAVVGEGTVRATLVGHGALVPDDAGDLTIALDRPRLWSAEDPFLHGLELEVRDADGALTEVITQKVGVRRFGIEDGVLRINGKRLVLHGVNRHELGLDGRVMTRAEIEADLRQIKAANIDAVRTCHYPNSTAFYELCDEYGLYVIDEMNLESHGWWARAAGLIEPAEALPGDRPEWLPALLDRAASMLERDKNHPCVVMWSCGNESFGGSTILAVADWFRSVDDRPVHYEGTFWDARYPATSDVVSQMYTPAAGVEEYLRTHRDKPFILCEFAHAMGTSFGAVDRYLDLADREPLFQGGFIWDFADQAVRLTDRHGRAFLGYGGDCDDRPHDGEFSANGIVFADRTPTPKLQEVRYLYQPFRIALRDEEIELTSRRLFTGTDDLECVVTLRREGAVLAEAHVAIDVPPGEKRAYPLPVAVPGAPGEYTIDVSLRLRDDARWAPAGHEVAWRQRVVAVAGTTAPARVSAEPPVLVRGLHNVGVRGPRFEALFSLASGGLVSYRFGETPETGRELLRVAPHPSFWHAPTANERGWGMPARDGQWLLASRYARPLPDRELPDVVAHADHVEVRSASLLPTTPTSECDVTYRVFGDGRVEVALALRPGADLPDPPELGMLVTADAELRHVRWYGDGPEECYVDRRSGARLGVYSGDVATQLTANVRPQESGSHTGVRWAEVTDDRGAGMRFDAAGAGSTGGMEFSALPWTPFEIENARHPNELPPILHTILRPGMRRGVGGDDSWGARTHPEYLLPRGDLTFAFSFVGVG